MRNIRKILPLCVIAIACISFVFASKVRHGTAPAQPTGVLPAESSRYIMTVFVHGTVGPHLSFKAIGGWFKYILRGGDEKLKNLSVFQKYIEQVKRYSFHRFQPIHELGLVEIDLDKPVEKDGLGYYALQTSKFYKKVFDQAHQNHSDELGFYTFGWSGRLSCCMRREAGKELYDALFKKVEQVAKEKNKPVEVWLLAHSHGVNVILNLEEEERVQKQKLCISKAIFFGGPVQTETEELVHGGVFKNIYNVYSHGDHMQRLDCVSTQDWFSRQKFGAHKKKKISLPNNLHQIEVQIGGCKPYHYELWLWGMKNFPYFFYRRRVSLFPLPVSIFTPEIISLVDSIDTSKSNDRYCLLRVDGNEGRFDLHGVGQKVSGLIDTKSLCKEGRQAL